MFGKQVASTLFKYYRSNVEPLAFKSTGHLDWAMVAQTATREGLEKHEGGWCAENVALALF